MARKLFVADLNWSLSETPALSAHASQPWDWCDVDPDEYYDYHMLEIGDNCAYMQAVAFAGYAFYKSRYAPWAPGRGSELLPAIYRRAREDGREIWSYMCVGCDVFTCNTRQDWLVPGSRDSIGYGLLAPESPWTDLLCTRLEEFLRQYPVDVMQLDWFVYGNLKPDLYHIQPTWYMEGPFREICGRALPKTSEEISEEENLHYKREILARQFCRIQDTIKKASPRTKLCFNVPYWKPREALWEGHVMMEESDILFSESSTDVVNWLLEVKRPEQTVMTTIIGRQEAGETDVATWRKWYEKGCDFFGYGWGIPPGFKPHPRYDADLAQIKEAFREMR